MSYFDKDGNEVTNVYTKEQVDQMIADAVKNAAPAPVTPPAPAPAPAAPIAPAPEPNPLAEEVKRLSETVSAFVGSHRTATIDRFAAGMDADTRKLYEERFTALQGYGETPQEIERRAADAYLLQTGQKFEGNSFNMSNLANVNGRGPTSTVKVDYSEEDKKIGSVLGNTEEDYKKFGNQ